MMPLYDVHFILYGEYDLSLSLTLFHAIIHFLAWNVYMYFAFARTAECGYCACWNPWKVACLRDKWALISSHYHHFQIWYMHTQLSFRVRPKNHRLTHYYFLHTVAVVTNVPKCQQCPNFYMHWFSCVVILFLFFDDGANQIWLEVKIWLGR